MQDASLICSPAGSFSDRSSHQLGIDPDYHGLTVAISRAYRPVVFESRTALLNILKSNAVLNASGAPLSDTEIEALCLGLSFVTAYEPPPGREPCPPMMNHLERWLQTLNKTLHFSDTDGDPRTGDRTRGWLKFESDWIAPDQSWSANPACGTEIRRLAELCRMQPCLTHEPIYQAVRNLGKRPDIHITKADKGRNVVVWSADDYDREAHRLLSDPATYDELSSDEFARRARLNKAKAKLLTQTLLDGGHVSPSESRYITRNEADGALIYFLPKTHKKKQPVSGTFPGRPIVATYSSSTHGLDVYLTELTKPILFLIPGVLKDTSDLLLKLPNGGLAPDAEIITADVDSLYPSIPWTEGLQAATDVYSKFLDSLREKARTEGLRDPPPPTLFGRIMRLVITSAVVSFKGKRFFQQTSGTAMGTCISVYFANAYMYAITSSVVHNPPPDVLIFVRFIDDLLVITKGGTRSNPNWAVDFFDRISNSYIRYTVNRDEGAQAFLDVLLSVNVQNGTVTCEPYRKPTASGNYLHPRSCHPRHVLSSLPYSQFLRLRRISSSDELYDKHAKRLFRELRANGYQSKLLKKSFDKAKGFDRRTLLEGTQAAARRNEFNLSLKFIAPFATNVDWREVRRQIQRVHCAIVDHYRGAGETSKVDALEQRGSRLVFRIRRNIGSYFTGSFKKGAQAHPPN